MNIVCKLKGHDWIFKRIIDDNSGLYQGSTKLMPMKEYECSRCGTVQRGISVTKEDHHQMMEYAKLAVAQHQYDMSRMPQRIQELKEEVKGLKRKKK